MRFLMNKNAKPFNADLLYGDQHILIYKYFHT